MAGNHTKKYIKKQQKKFKKAFLGTIISLLLLVLLSLGIFTGYFYEGSFADLIEELGLDELGIFTQQASTRPFIDPEGDEMALHFIDVGQGDSTLLQTPKGSALIDCGEKEYGDDVVAYLEAQGVSELEYFIITHPDSDHMGAAAYVLENVPVKNFVINGKEKTANFFENALDVIEEKNIYSLIAEPGDVFTIGALRMEILGPRVDDINELDSNDSSLIIYATYGSKAFLFTGDAEKKGEELLLKYNAQDIKCDVFSAGHHGAKTSNSLELLIAASPKYVVVSCGKNNSYGHPTSEAISNFASVNATVLRTDELGTVVITTDGTDIKVK